METTEAVSKTETQATPKKKTVDQVSKREKFVPMTDEDGVMVNRLIGIAVDKSDHSRRAFDWYVTNMHRPDNRLAIIHCHSIPDIEVTSDDQGQLLVSSKWKDMANDSYKKCQELLNTYKELCQSKKISFEIHLGTKMGHKIGAEIIDIVEARGISWIIMGSRGLDTLRRTILGSVSDYLLHHSSVPVTIVPPP